MDDENGDVEQAQTLIRELAEVTGSLSDREVAEALGRGEFDDLFTAILDPSEVEEAESYADFFLENKYCAQLLAMIRHAITRNYSYGSSINGQTAYVAPSHYQWYENSVMLLEGTDRFQGHVARYDGDNLMYMVAGRKIEGPDEIGPSDVEWITLEEIRQRLDDAPERLIQRVEETLAQLRELLSAKVNDEGRYQELIERNPRAFRLQYTDIARHEALDDDNIPDFTGVRARDGYHDIIEIKPPFRPIFKQTGGFRAEFLGGWDQIERYLGFVLRERNYLAREKGLEFENPKCYLIAGYDLTEEERRRITEKEERNPAITVFTYDDLIKVMSDTLELLNNPPVS